MHRFYRGRWKFAIERRIFVGVYVFRDSSSSVLSSNPPVLKANILKYVLSASCSWIQYSTVRRVQFYVLCCTIHDGILWNRPFVPSTNFAQIRFSHYIRKN